VTASIASVGVLTTGGIVKTVLSPFRVLVPSEVSNSVGVTSNVTRLPRDVVENALGTVAEVGFTLGNAAAQTAKNAANLIGEKAMLGNQRNSSSTTQAVQRLAGNSIKSVGNVLEALNEALKHTVETANKTVVDIFETQFGRRANEYHSAIQDTHESSNPKKSSTTYPIDRTIGQQAATFIPTPAKQQSTEPQLIIPLATDTAGNVKVVLNASNDVIM